MISKQICKLKDFIDGIIGNTDMMELIDGKLTSDGFTADGNELMDFCFIQWMDI